ncbi:LOW QUALITY PROTEIN: hypothetical protein PHMEG_00019686 [Phytophthora megakarya]|uniref:Uncharacterized protein n=1 Tax=Phytophthora megakarya TaxID=4795 RepID=A0A225VRA5_9STRA|nr:LOW QUALITY PROTEIN: hypothetical protein PHMEG_00019686 [Phytophthora megakarya]
MLAIITETKKIENRKAYLKGKAGDRWEITKFLTLRYWTVNKLCLTRDEVLEVDETNFGDMNEHVILEEFEHLVDIDGTMVSYLGLSHRELCFATFSSLSGIKILIWSCQLMVLIVSTREDGHLLIVVKSLSRESQQASFSASDHGYIFVRAKSKLATFEADVRVHSANFDHADVITSALESVWPHIEILTCSEHLYLGSLESKVGEKGFTKDIGETAFSDTPFDTFTKPIQGCLKTSRKCVNKRRRRCSRQLAPNSLPGSMLGVVKREQLLRSRFYSTPAANRE